MNNWKIFRELQGVGVEENGIYYTDSDYKGDCVAYVNHTVSLKDYKGDSFTLWNEDGEEKNLFIELMELVRTTDYSFLTSEEFNSLLEFTGEKLIDNILLAEYLENTTYNRAIAVFKFKNFTTVEEVDNFLLGELDYKNYSDCI